MVAYAERLLALVASRRAVEVTRELETVGVFDFHGAVTRSMTAHPKLCPYTGELLFFSYGATPPLLTYFRADVVDARRFDAPPVAEIHLRARVPFGLHGDWLPKSTLRERANRE